MTAPVLHLRGAILVGPEEERPEAWVVGGRLTFERPTGAGLDVQTEYCQGRLLTAVAGGPSGQTPGEGP